MIVITGLEFRFGAPNIMFGGAIRCDRGFVNDSQTDFLDVTFNLKSGKYWPYCKPNDQPLYLSMWDPTIRQ